VAGLEFGRVLFLFFVFFFFFEGKVLYLSNKLTLQLLVCRQNRVRELDIVLRMLVNCPNSFNGDTDTMIVV